MNIACFVICSLSSTVLQSGMDPDYSLFSMITIDVTIERQSSFYAKVYVAPICFLLLLVPIIFLLPPDSPEKLTYGKLPQTWYAESPVLICHPVDWICLGYRRHTAVHHDLCQWQDRQLLSVLQWHHTVYRWVEELSSPHTYSFVREFCNAANFPAHLSMAGGGLLFVCILLTSLISSMERIGRTRPLPAWVKKVSGTYCYTMFVLRLTWQPLITLTLHAVHYRICGPVPAGTRERGADLPGYCSFEIYEWDGDGRNCAERAESRLPGAWGLWQWSGEYHCPACNVTPPISVGDWPPLPPLPSLYNNLTSDVWTHKYLLG